MLTRVGGGIVATGVLEVEVLVVLVLRKSCSVCILASPPVP